MLARVSHLEAFRRWRLNEESSVDELVRYITRDEPTEIMRVGTAFHQAMEEAEPGEYETLSALGCVFFLDGAEASIELPPIREVRTSRDYGELTVTGKCDGLWGRAILDHKTTWSAFDAEPYLAGCQWKFYLDLFDADKFVWLVYRLHELGPHEYRVELPERLTAWRYPELHQDCERLAADYAVFAREHLPEMEMPA